MAKRETITVTASNFICANFIFRCVVLYAVRFFVIGDGRLTTENAASPTTETRNY